MGTMMEKNVHEVDFGAGHPSENLQNFPNVKWMQAGIELLKTHGPRSVTVEKVCVVMDADKAEFNRRFDDIESFFASILDYWYEKETLAYIDLIDEISGSAEDVLRAMIEIHHYACKEDEVAIRNWALKCSKTNAALERVDRTRLDVVIGLFSEMGFSEKEASMRAKILYTSKLGTEYTSISATLERKLEMCELLMRKN